STAPATYLDHWILEMGAPYTGQEIGATGYSRELGMCFAFSRGAARQYEKPWRMYLAVSIQGGGLGYTEPIYCYLSPECRRRRSYGDTGKFWGEGPYCGTSLSLQRRQLFVAYMSGVNMIRDENDNHGGGLFYAANYNWRDIDKVDPLVKVMRDKPYHLSQAGEIRKELYDNLFKKHDRGVAYTPVGLVFDRHHGFIWTYSHNKVMGILPYTEGDWMMPAVQSALFPFLVRKDSEARSTGPYGDMFDVLTNNARQETLRAYRALLLVGDVDLDVRDLADPKRKPYMFAKRLMDYVENGGTLMINARQIKAGVFPDSFLGCKITEERGEGQFGYSLPDDEVIKEDKPFKYQRLEPVTAIPLILRADTDGKQDALVTVNKCGKGMVIVTAPDYMMPAGGGERAMLNMFKHIMGGWRDELLPVKWTGDVEVLVNRNRNGWVVTLVNNEGVIKQAGQKEEFDAAHDQDVWLRLEKRAGGGQVKNIDEWIKGEKPEMRKTDDGAEVKITVPAGDIRILEFHL
ncbi:MAG: hypothetical protein PHP98_07540, partial [Kiritimatiellae bacterium]|nr:hypothetical protein [Kiritimatiellia bacterium]